MTTLAQFYGIALNQPDPETLDFLDGFFVQALSSTVGLFQLELADGAYQIVFGLAQGSLPVAQWTPVQSEAVFQARFAQGWNDLPAGVQQTLKDHARSMTPAPLTLTLAEDEIAI